MGLFDTYKKNKKKKKLKEITQNIINLLNYMNDNIYEDFSVSLISKIQLDEMMNNSPNIKEYIGSMFILHFYTSICEYLSEITLLNYDIVSAFFFNNLTIEEIFYEKFKEYHAYFDRNYGNSYKIYLCSFDTFSGFISLSALPPKEALRQTSEYDFL